MNAQHKTLLNIVHRLFTKGLIRHYNEVGPYLESRGLFPSYLHRAGVGYLSLKDVPKFLELVERAGGVEVAKEVGLITPSGHMLTGGIFFPVYDQDGSIQTFSIRLLPEAELVQKGASPHWTLKIPPKYPLGCMYPRSGMDPLKGRATFICEGAIDTITLLQNGYQALGLLGVSNWKPHFTDFLGSREAIIAFDRDENKSGQRAAMKLASKIAGRGMIGHVYILRLPMGEDINSFYTEEFFTYMKKNLIDFNETKQGQALIKRMQDNKGKKKYSDNQMTQKVLDAKAKPITQVFQALYPSSRLYDFARGFKTRCVFHDDSRASLHIYTDTNSFFCFGCQASGDTIDLVREANPGWDFNNEVLPYIEGI